MFVNPSLPNIADFYAYCISQGVPAADIPSGALTTVSITTSGSASAASVSGTVQAGQALIASEIASGTYVASWSGTSGTVSPAPTASVSAPSVEAYSPYIVWSLNQSMEIALPSPGVGGGMSGFAGQYVMAVYALALHYLLVMGQDQVGSSTFFTQARAKYNIGSLVPGPVMASGDQATSETLVVPEFFKSLTLSDLELLQTPYGRRYMGYAQMYGSTIVGVS